MISRFSLNMLSTDLTSLKSIYIGAGPGIWLIHCLPAFTLSFFPPLGTEKLSSLLKNEEVVTPSGELNTENFDFLQNPCLFSVGTLFLDCNVRGVGITLMPLDTQATPHFFYTPMQYVCVCVCVCVLLHQAPVPLHRKPHSSRPTVQTLGMLLIEHDILNSHLY